MYQLLLMKTQEACFQERPKTSSPLTSVLSQLCQIKLLQPWFTASPGLKSQGQVRQKETIFPRHFIQSLEWNLIDCLARLGIIGSSLSQSLPEKAVGLCLEWGLPLFQQ